MADVYADHPFPLIASPAYEGKKLSKAFEPDMFERVAGEMACVHNMIVRGLNSIYLQAPHIPLPEVPAFIQYSLIWYKLVHLHQSCEEPDFFPLIETISGETGIMSGNVEQHHAFQEELVTFYLYLKECANDPTQFSGNRILSSIDSFGRVLVQHLTEEIPTIVGLQRFGVQKMGQLETRFSEDGKKNMVRMPVAVLSSPKTEESQTGRNGPCGRITLVLLKP
ncbi:hypothetical protein HYQ44_009127 [Verticillium longisporum]|nr:hypothetical protein HYQ44_009127 [Verticillium longisporum]